MNDIPLQLVEETLNISKRKILKYLTERGVLLKRRDKRSKMPCTIYTSKLSVVLSSIIIRVSRD